MHVLNNKKESPVLPKISSDDDIEIVYDSIVKKGPKKSGNAKSKATSSAVDSGASSSIVKKGPKENGNAKSKATSSVVDSVALSNDIDAGGNVVDDEGVLVPPEDEITNNTGDDVDISIEYEKIVNSGAYPKFSWKKVEKIIKDLRKHSCYQKANKEILNHYNSNVQVYFAF